VPLDLDRSGTFYVGEGGTGTLDITAVDRSVARLMHTLATSPAPQARRRSTAPAQPGPTATTCTWVTTARARSTSPAADRSAAGVGFSHTTRTSTGRVTVDGPGSSWTNSNGLSVGFDGPGTLDITNGGRVSNSYARLAKGPARRAQPRSTVPARPGLAPAGWTWVAMATACSASLMVAW